MLRFLRSSEGRTILMISSILAFSFLLFLMVVVNVLDLLP